MAAAVLAAPEADTSEVAYGAGTECALAGAMATITHHEDIVAWQLATELKERLFEIIARPAIAGHFKFCDQIKRSSRSAPANIAEGFWRYRPRENARFVRIALGSLGETANHLRDAWKEKYIDDVEYQTLSGLALRAIGTAIGWHSYLMECPDKQPERLTTRRTGQPDVTDPTADSDSKP